MRIVVRCADCSGYGYTESKDMSSARTTDCYACDGTGEVTYTETYESFYEAEQDYINQDVIRIAEQDYINHAVIKAGKGGTDPTIKLYPPYMAMQQVEKIEFIREVKNQLTKYEEHLINGLARNEGQMEIEYNGIQ